MEDKFLAHWVYQDYEWDIYVDTESQRVEQAQRRLVIMSATLAVGLTGLAILLFLLSFIEVHNSGLAAASGCLVFVCLFVLLFLVGPVLASYRGSRVWYNRLRAVPREIIITDTTILFGDDRTHRVKRLMTIRSGENGIYAHIERGPFSTLIVGGIDEWSRWRRGALRIPIPEGREAEAGALARRFNTPVPKAGT